jgi:hypothetical protein
MWLVFMVVSKMKWLQEKDNWVLMDDAGKAGELCVQHPDGGTVSIHAFARHGIEMATTSLRYVGHFQEITLAKGAVERYYLS